MEFPTCLILASQRCETDYPLKSLTNLREAFLVFLSLTVIALFNAGLLWEEQKISQQYMNFELTQMLEMNENQMEKIRSIQTLYEIEVSKSSVKEQHQCLKK